MVQIKFSNNGAAAGQVFLASGVRMASNCIYGVFNGNEVPIAHGTGDMWHVGQKIFNSVEIVSILKTNMPKAA